MSEIIAPDRSVILEAMREFFGGEQADEAADAVRSMFEDEAPPDSPIANLLGTDNFIELQNLNVELASDRVPGEERRAAVAAAVQDRLSARLTSIADELNGVADGSVGTPSDAVAAWYSTWTKVYQGVRWARAWNPSGDPQGTHWRSVFLLAEATGSVAKLFLGGAPATKHESLLSVIVIHMAGFITQIPEPADLLYAAGHKPGTALKSYSTANQSVLVPPPPGIRSVTGPTQPFDDFVFFGGSIDLSSTSQPIHLSASGDFK